MPYHFESKLNLFKFQIKDCFLGFGYGPIFLKFNCVIRTINKYRRIDKHI